VTWEATSKRVTPKFLAANTVTSLLAKSDFELEGYGRLTHPLVYDRASDTLRPTSWESAFARIGEVVSGMQPDEVEFYTSGRASNEAAWLFQLFARELGTNNFPTVRICAMNRPASGCRSRSASARERCRWMILIKPSW
jgi:anaerobic selenocysteine-containing dehydrogenase